MSQQSMFEQTRHPGTTPKPATPPKSHKGDVYARIRGTWAQESQHRQYLRLLYVAKTRGVTLSGRTVHSLTDHEAAHLLGLQRTTINGRRNELACGSGSPAWMQQPLVVEAEKRKCLVQPSRYKVTAYTLAPTPFDEAAHAD